jgi:hypothetical protein
MACYTVSDCVLENLGEGKSYTTELLITFIQVNNHKIAIDEKGEIKKIYTSIATQIKDSDLKKGVFGWLSLMAMKPTKWEYIEIENSHDDIFLDVCSNTIDKTMIVSSENKCKWKNGISQERKFSYYGAEIRFLNKDDAIQELKPKTNNFNLNNTNTNTNTNS